MAKAKIDKATAIKSILSDLKKGIDKKSILQKFSKSYTNSTKSFYNYFEVAERQFNDFRAKIEPIIVAETAKHELESILPTNDQMLAHLANLAMNAEFEKDQIAATVNYLKARGGFMPIKTDITTNGESINIINLGSGVKPK